MAPGFNFHRSKGSYGYNRLNTILAIIFLLCGLLVFRLFSLQVGQYDMYIALASDQHSYTDSLEAKRGQIYIQDNLSLLFLQKPVKKLY